MLQQFSDGSLTVRLPKALKDADAGQVHATPIHNAQDFIFLGKTTDILEQLGCICSNQEVTEAILRKSK